MLSFTKLNIYLRGISIIIILAFLFSCTLSCKSNKEDILILKEKITSILDKEEGNYAIAFIDLGKPQNSLFYREHDHFHAASTMKTPVLFELYKQERKGMLRLTDSVEVKNEFKSIVDSSTYSMAIGEDSNEILYKQIGQNATIYDLAYLMITESSNLATNILIEIVGAENVNNSMRVIGAKNIKVLRGVEDIKAYDLGLSNSTTAYDLMLLFEKLGKNQLVDSLASFEMTKILLDQKFNDIIPSLLPDKVKVAHKTGSITRIMHDSALVLLPDGRKYVLVLLSGGWNEEERARKTMAEISLLIYSYMLLKE